MYNTSQCSRGIPNKSDSEQKQDNFYYSSPKAATDMGVSSSESHDLTAFYEMLSASFGVLSQNTGFYPSLDRIIETTLGPLNLGPGGGSYNEPISRLQRLVFSFWAYFVQPPEAYKGLAVRGGQWYPGLLHPDIYRCTLVGCLPDHQASTTTLFHWWPVATFGWCSVYPL